MPECPEADAGLCAAALVVHGRTMAEPRVNTPRGAAATDGLTRPDVVGRDGIEPPNLPVFSRTLYQLSYLPRSDRGDCPGPSRGPDGI
jgi:hypothetical protein